MCNLEKIQELLRQLEEIDGSLDCYRQYIDDPSCKWIADEIEEKLNSCYDVRKLGYDDSKEILELAKCAVEILHKRYMIVCHEIRITLQKLEVAEGLRTR